MGLRSRLDLLSDLPLSIIHSILRFVPIRDAVKTSILSRQWRYIWATLPYLVFDDECVSTCEEENEKDRETKLKDFINQALLVHKGPIHMFKLHHVLYMESCYIDPWLLFLSRTNIRMLILDAKETVGGFKIHSSIYCCESLTHLELVKCEIPPPPPTFNGFLSLRSLVLKFGKVPCKAIEIIVAKSPRLEEFTLRKYSGCLEFRIHAPNLKQFDVTGHYKEIILFAPLFSKFSVAFFNDDFTTKSLEQKSSVCNYTDFLGGCTNLEELIGGCSFIKYLSIGVESYHCSLVFHRLRVIELWPVSFRDIKDVRVILRLIMGAPNLQKLIISSVSKLIYQSEVAGIPVWDSECAPNFTFDRMKVIELIDVGGGGLYEIEFIKFLLENSPLLELLIFKAHPFLDNEKIIALTAELLRCRRASANAEVLFSKSL